MAYPVKHKELHDYYYSVKNPQVTYSEFRTRCINNKDRLTVSLLEYLIMKKVKSYNSLVNEEWRECSFCRIHKPRTEYNKWASNSNGFSSRCRWCNNKMKIEINDKIIYSNDNLYKYNVKTWSRKWENISVKQIAENEWIDKKYLEKIRQKLGKWLNIEEVISYYKNSNIYFNLS